MADEWSLQLIRIEWVDGRTTHWAGWKATFSVELHGLQSELQVPVPYDTVATDVARVAMHRLALRLADLAENMAEFRQAEGAQAEAQTPVSQPAPT